MCRQISRHILSPSCASCRHIVHTSSSSTWCSVSVALRSRHGPRLPAWVRCVGSMSASYIGKCPSSGTSTGSLGGLSSSSAGATYEVALIRGTGACRGSLLDEEALAACLSAMLLAIMWLGFPHMVSACPFCSSYPLPAWRSRSSLCGSEHKWGNVG